MKKWGLILVLLLISCAQDRGYPGPPIEGDNVVIDIKGLKEDTPVFYELKVDGRDVRFFVLKLGERVESYLDACMKCYPHKMGFKTEGFRLICRYCGVEYPLDTLRSGIGSCYPIPLEGRQESDKYLISLESLKEAKRYF